MDMMPEYKTYFQYYMVLENEFFNTEPYVAIEEGNYNTYSTEYVKILLSVCGEIDSMMKMLCRELKKDETAQTIGGYFKILDECKIAIQNESVDFTNQGIILLPWKNWTSDNAPVWWTDNNKVKHHRTEIYRKTNTGVETINYTRANLKNVMSSLAALYIIEEYYIYFFDFSKMVVENESQRETEMKKCRDNALLNYKSCRCNMAQWMNAEYLMSFMGESFVQSEKLNLIMNNTLEKLYG